ncbi:MAG: HlyC/CorC family transporter, partial [Clostridia bacterium]|nr:HlyC/CorC family transporter [Clostridia bacterium]
SNIINFLGASNFGTGDALAIVGVILLLAFSAFFSSAETAFSKVNLIRMKNYADEKRKGARRALYICENFDKTLSTILVGNNLVNIASTTICAYLFGKFIIDPTIANLVNTVAMTIIVLIFGEIMPKSIAKNNPENYAMKISGILYFFMKVLTPITFFFGLLQKAANRKSKEAAPTVTEDELESIIDTMTEEGVIDSEEANLLQGALDLSTHTVYDIMTPRVDIIAVSIDDNLDVIKDTFIEYQFSRLPVYENDKDNIVGILNQKDFMTKILKNEEVVIKELMAEPTFVTETMKVDDLIRLMQKEKKHLTIVLDEYGGTSGIVSMEDALEEMVGEIYDEHDDEEEIIVPINKVSETEYILNPEVSIEDLYKELEIEHLPESSYSSVGGMLYEMSESVPELGSVFNVTAIDDVLNDHNDYVQTITELTYTITKMEERRITEVHLLVNRHGEEDEKDSKEKDSETSATDSNE